jgi:hypothetical protein
MPMRDVRLVAAIAAVGIVVCFSTPEPAAAAPTKSTASADKSVTQSKYKRRAHSAKKSRSARYARRSSSKTVAKTSDKSKQTAATSKTELLAAILNAHAEAPPKQRSLAEDEARNFAALDSTDKVSTINGVQVAASDQLNDVDRALTDESAPALVPTAKVASAAEALPANKIIRPAPSADNQAARKANDSDPWSSSSLLGKIFIAFGSLLTLASAARILIA